MDEQAGLQEHQRTASVPPPKFTTTTTSTPPHPPTAEVGVDLGHRLVDGGGGEGAESWSAGAKKKKKLELCFVFFFMAGMECRGIVGFSLNSASIIWQENSKFKSD